MKHAQRLKMLASLHGLEDRLVYRRLAREKFNATYYPEYYSNHERKARAFSPPDDIVHANTRDADFARRVESAYSKSRAMRGENVQALGDSR